jgi:UDP-N-acetylglucosamine acyltransferase
MRPHIHPTAIVESGAELGGGVKVGPLCFVGDGARIGDGTELVAQVTVMGPTRIGSGCRIFPFTALGLPPQDRSWAGESTGLEIGDDCILREQVTIHRGTAKGGGTTRVGSRCLLKVGVHVAHDCQLADDLVLGNLTTLGGAVLVNGSVVTGGHVSVAPFVRVWRASLLAGGAMVERDVPPFTVVAGDRARVRGINLAGLRRMGVAPASRKALGRAYRRLWRSDLPMLRALEAVERELGSDPYVAELTSAVRACMARPQIALPSRSSLQPGGVARGPIA